MMQCQAAIERQRERGLSAMYAPVAILLAFSIIGANVVSLYFSRIGIIPDLLLLSVSIPAFLWSVGRGVDIRNLGLFVLIISAMALTYVIYSAAALSYIGFRNVAAMFTAAATFLFFYRESHLLCRSAIFLIALLMPLSTFALLWDSPYAVAKNNINGAMCYYLIAVFLCVPGLGRMRSIHVVLLFLLIFVLSMVNDHRTLAGSSVLLLLQYFMLSSNIARSKMRALMFIGLVVTIAGVIWLLVDPVMSKLTSAWNSEVLEEGGRRLMSGRDVLWPVVWKAIAEHPAFGLGPGTVLSDIYTTNLSAHNLYLQIGLQIGYGGFVFLLLMFWSLWRVAGRESCLATRVPENLMTVVITMVAIHSLFAVFLLQNALAVGVPVWMVLGLGLGELARQRIKYRPLFGFDGGRIRNSFA
jgi:O-antigen ligase